jgi:hypothetical protein
MGKSGVCDRALTKAHELKNVTVFCCLTAFLPQKAFDKMMHCK